MQMLLGKKKKKKKSHLIENTFISSHMNNDVRIQSCIITVIFVTKHDICAKLLNLHSLKDEGLREKCVLSH